MIVVLGPTVNGLGVTLQKFCKKKRVKTRPFNILLAAEKKERPGPLVQEVASKFWKRRWTRR
jgi:hypothetical protein